MARRPAKKRPSGTRKRATAQGHAVPPVSSRSPHVGNAVSIPGATHPTPIHFPLLAPTVPLAGASRNRAPLAGVPLPVPRKTPASTATRAVSAGSPPSRAPQGAGPAPLPPAQPMPTLARVGGAAGTTGALEFVRSPFSVMAAARPHALGITYWFDPPATAGSHEVVVRLAGRRLDVEGARTPADDFVALASLAEVRGGSGRTSLTHRVVGKAPGRWHVAVDAMAIPKGADRSDGVRLPSAEAVGSSTFAPVATMRAPGVVLGAWPAMVGLGVVLALILQGALARAHGLPPTKVLVLALVASVLGAVGAKLYYRLTHLKESRGRSLAGLSVQGFVIVATATFVIGGALQGMAVGHLLDATVPALLLAQAVGRLGCLLAGCCTGIPTRSRWAVWSSDRRVGTRRVPVQLMESAAAGTLALVTAVIAWRVPTSWEGFLFVGGVAAYVVVRQLLFPLRGVPRATRHGRQVTLVVALLAMFLTLMAPLVG